MTGKLHFGYSPDFLLEQIALEAAVGQGRPDAVFAEAGLANPEPVHLALRRRLGMAVLLELDDDDVVERRPLSVARVDEAEVDVNRQARSVLPLLTSVMRLKQFSTCGVSPSAANPEFRFTNASTLGSLVHRSMLPMLMRFFCVRPWLFLVLIFDKRQARADVFACPYFLPDAAAVMVHQIHASVRSVEVDGAIGARPHAARLLSPVVRLQHRQQHFELAFGRDVFRVNPVHQPDFGHLRKADAGKGRQQSVDFLKIHVCLTFHD